MKGILRLYDIPDNTFESDEESEDSEEGEQAGVQRCGGDFVCVKMGRVCCFPLSETLNALCVKRTKSGLVCRQITKCFVLYLDNDAIDTPLRA